MASVSKLCACIGYAIRVSKREGQQDVTNMLQHALFCLVAGPAGDDQTSAEAQTYTPRQSCHIGGSGNKTAGKLADNMYESATTTKFADEGETGRRSISLYSALQLTADTSTRVGGGWTSGLQHATCTQYSCIATQTDFEVITRPMCEALMTQLAERSQKCVLDLRQRLVDEQLRVVDLREELSRMTTASHVVASARDESTGSGMAVPVDHPRDDSFPSCLQAVLTPLASDLDLDVASNDDPALSAKPSCDSFKQLKDRHRAERVVQKQKRREQRLQRLQDRAGDKSSARPANSLCGLSMHEVVPPW